MSFCHVDLGRMVLDEFRESFSLKVSGDFRVHYFLQL